MARRSRREKREAGREIKNKFQPEIPSVTAKTENQKDLIRSLIENQVTIASGPPGVGKTHIAAYRAASDYLSGRVDRIIIARPYKHMGNYAGHLPGTLVEKLTPLLRPLIDNLKKFIGTSKFEADLGKGIEIDAVENIRGRSFDENCWILITESQNTTQEQMKSIITRLGENAICCIEGDPNQSDINGENGLSWVTSLVNNHKVSGMNVVEFSTRDIVRSGLVKEFIMLLEEIGTNKDRY